MPARNVVVAQSGGPTCVINNSLRGIVDFDGLGERPQRGGNDVLGFGEPRHKIQPLGHRVPG